MERLHIVDGYGYIYRAHYGMAGPTGRGVRLATEDGMPTAALYVYAQMLVRLHQDVHPDRIVVVFDAPGRNFRLDIDPEYKATRRETPDDLKEQLPHFRPLTEAFAWPVVAVPDVEADDVIATLVQQARERDWEVTIFSADKDLMQLVDDHVLVFDSMRQKKYDKEGVVEKFGVAPAKVADWLALVGDNSDNIPGMPGVGKKTAAKFLNEFGSIDGLLSNIDKLKGKMKERFEDSNNLERLETSRKLVALKHDVEIGCTLDSLVPRKWDGERLAAELRKFEFHALLERLDPGAGTEVAQPSVTIAETVDAATDWADINPVLDAAEAHGRLAIAIEADDKRADRQRLIGLALAAPEADPIYVPISHHYLGVPKQLALSETPNRLRTILSTTGPALVIHDAKTTRRVLRREGIELQSVRTDTMLAAYLADPSSEDFGLEAIAKASGGITLVNHKKLLGTGRKHQTFDAIPIERAATFLGRRGQAALVCAPVLERRVESAGAGSLLRELEQPLAELLADIEDTGIHIDLPFLAALSDQVAGQIAELERDAHSLAGEAFNLGSPKQLSSLLFGKLGLASGKKTKSGAYSTDHEVLEGLRQEHAIVPIILEHRELTKLKGTYIDALPPLVHPDSGRLHTSFRQAVAATGRLSSQDPNLQNIPIRSDLGREIRRAFVADKGKVLVSADYSQIELRIMAHLSGDAVLCKAFRNDIDVHTQTAAEVFDIAVGDVGSRERRVAKAVNYGLIYGQSAFGLGRSLDIPQSEAKQYIARYFDRFGTVRTFMDDLVARARQKGYAETIMGRRRPIPNVRSKNFRLRSAAERIAQNTPMQGSAADIMKLAMLKVANAIEKLDYSAAILLTVHDELVLEVAPEHAEDLARMLADEMSSAFALDVPLVVDTGIAKNWADAH